MKDTTSQASSVTAKVTAELNSGPTIHELFSQAKKLLALQPRVEYRKVRKDSMNRQPSQDNLDMGAGTTTALASGATNPTAHLRSIAPNPLSRVLDLLLPLSVDDLRGSVSTSLTVEKVSNSKKLGPSQCGVTPMSIDDSPSARSDISLRDTNITAHTTPQNSSIYNIKREPRDSIPDSRAPGTSFTANNHNNGMAQFSRASSDKELMTANSAILGKEGQEYFKVKSSSTSSQSSELSYQSNLNSNPHSNPNSTSNSNSNITPQPQKSNLTFSLQNQSRKQLTGAVDPKDVKGSVNKVSGSKPTECSNCQTLKTPLWRKDSAGNTLCNACGLFLKLHGSTRPLSLKTDVIRKRSSRRTSQTSRGGMPSSVSNSVPKQFFREGMIPETGVVNSDFENSLPNRMVLIAPSPYGYNNSMMNNPARSLEASASKPKNVLILPKPSAAGSGPNSAVSTPIIGVAPGFANSYNNQMSTPSSPYSTSASLQFKRKKSEINNAELFELANRRHPSFVAMNNSYTNLSGINNSVKRVYSMASMPHRNSATSLSRTPNPCLTCYVSGPGSYAKPNMTPLASFTQTNLYFEAQPESFGRKRSFISQIDGFGPGDTPSSLSSPPYYGITEPNLEPRRSIAPTEIEKFGGASFDEITNNVNGDMNSNSNNNLNSSSFRSAASPKNLDDVDSDDFFKNYTSLHNEMLGDEITPSLPDSVLVGSMGDMGEKHLIKAANTQSTLTRGLQGHSLAPKLLYLDTCPTNNASSDLDWLKFEI